MSRSKVTIFVPCYNHERYVTKLIETIFAQSFTDFELIVIDDGSKDHSPQILTALSEKYNFKLVLKENEGLCKTLNRGIDLASGEFFTCIASDDFIPPERIREQVDFLEANPNVDVVAGSEMIVDTEGVECGLKSPKIKGFVTFQEMIKINRVLTATVMMRTSVFQRFGNYNELHTFEDYHMWLKMLKNGGTIFNTTQMWAYYRISNQDLEKKINWYYKGAVQALSDYKSDPFVMSRLEKHKLVYCIKLSLVVGSAAREKYRDVFGSLNWLGRLVCRGVMLAPKFLRDQALILLRIKT
jgi:alpha-1,3-rhamnosyltransferase